MTEEKHGQIEVTRIQAKQAIIVAIIAAVPTMIGTIVATKALEKPSVQAASPITSAEEQRTPPQIFVASEHMKDPELSVAECKDRATSEIESRGGKIVASRDEWINLEWREFGIMITCDKNSTDGSVIVAGPDADANGDLAVSLRTAVFQMN